MWCFSCCRELAYQIADQFRVFGGHIGLKDAVVIGGIGVRYGAMDMPCGVHGACMYIYVILHVCVCVQI